MTSTPSASTTRPASTRSSSSTASNRHVLSGSAGTEVDGSMTGAVYSGAADAAGPGPMTPSRWKKALRSPVFSSYVILAVIVALFAALNPNFVSARNISNILAYLPELGIIALAMTLLMTAGEFDLGVGAVFAFGPVTAMVLVQKAGFDFGPALLI